MLLKNDQYKRQIRQMIESSEVDWGKLKDKSVLISGAAGMLGSGMVDVLIYLNEYMDYHITIYALGRTEEKLRRRYEEYVDADYFYILPLDVSHEMKVDQHVDYIVHAASNADPAMMAKYPVDTLMANVVGMDHLLALAREKKAERVLYVSSGEMYGQPDETVKNAYPTPPPFFLGPNTS